MSGIILCIDDEPTRYEHLRERLFCQGIYVINSCRIEEVRGYLDSGYEIIGICLDHDMPEHNGVEFAEVLREFNYPVVITSLNHPGVANISRVLDEYETPNLILPCTKTAWELEALLFWGIYDGI